MGEGALIQLGLILLPLTTTLTSRMLCCQVYLKFKRHTFLLQVPDFTFYRRSATKDPATKSSDSADSRKAFTYLMAGATGTAAAYGATSVVNAFVNR